jgi:hypothetical protein
LVYHFVFAENKLVVSLAATTKSMEKLIINLFTEAANATTLLSIQHRLM